MNARSMLLLLAVGLFAVAWSGDRPDQPQAAAHLATLHAARRNPIDVLRENARQAEGTLNERSTTRQSTLAEVDLPSTSAGGWWPHLASALVARVESWSLRDECFPGCDVEMGAAYGTAMHREPCTAPMPFDDTYCHIGREQFIDTRVTRESGMTFESALGSPFVDDERAALEPTERRIAGQDRWTVPTAIAPGAYLVVGPRGEFGKTFITEIAVVANSSGIAIPTLDHYVSGSAGERRHFVRVRTTESTEWASSRLTIGEYMTAIAAVWPEHDEWFDELAARIDVLRVRSQLALARWEFECRVDRYRRQLAALKRQATRWLESSPDDLWQALFLKTSPTRISRDPAVAPRF